MGANPERSPKRIKMDQNLGSEGGTARKSKSKYRPPATSQSHSHATNKYRQLVTVSASGIHNNDVGIFVTCDKGQERKCLQEVVDLLSEHFDRNNHTSSGLTEIAQSRENSPEIDIEAEIQAELDSLKPAQTIPRASTQKLTCVELDIPCVSFVRFPSSVGSSTSHDPVEIVRDLCTRAADKEFQGPRSRYIKRLTPISLVRKTMANGLETLCDELLPRHFGLDAASPTDDSTGNSSDLPNLPATPFKFAIRPTVRNNNKLDRDQVIRTVADKVASLGNGKHTVDLKGYDKLILVDVYRNIVGMSVVENDFEKLRRFNLSEIHASHFADVKT